MLILFVFLPLFFKQQMNTRRNAMHIRRIAQAQMGMMMMVRGIPSTGTPTVRVGVVTLRDEDSDPVLNDGNITCMDVDVGVVVVKSLTAETVTSLLAETDEKLMSMLDELTAVGMVTNVGVVMMSSLDVPATGVGVCMVADVANEVETASGTKSNCIRGRTSQRLPTSFIPNMEQLTLSFC
jgi:hypothetical protein